MNDEKNTAKSSESKRNAGIPTSFVTIDGRGAMVISKEIRKLANIKTGDKLAVYTHPTEDMGQKIILVKVDAFFDKSRVQQQLLK